ncbi:hypothetical protein [Thalassolituus sp.]|jgi:hypothetical protein|uniref:hypothetical protein n=1 Tax=Thalassolituus sp. TaxID=2030822 RepID=UPI0026331A32|nr:hypothetical protein [uncultured Thalassolituus sp.]|tara:strand:- start:278 stop:724 length:447 start_codon:yes stop_codon:yes gene_type:complete
MSAHGTVSAVLETLEGAQDVAKAIRSSGYLLDKNDLKRLLADLSASISETKMELTLLQGVIEEKDAELIRMHEAQVYRGNLKRRGDAYYKTLDGRPFGQPYCSYCWESDQKLFHLHNKILVRDSRICPHCKNEYQAVRTPFLEAANVA